MEELIKELEEADEKLQDSDPDQRYHRDLVRRYTSAREELWENTRHLEGEVREQVGKYLERGSYDELRELLES